MYLKFTKKHPAGINKGECKKVKDNQVAENFISEGFAELIEAEEYNTYASESRAKDQKASEKKMKEATDFNEKRQLTLPSETVPVTNENGEVTKNKGKRKQFHTLTEADINFNEDEAEGFEPGDEVLMDKDGNLAVNDKGSFIRKGNA